MRKRSKRVREKKVEQEPLENEDFKQSSPWKIVMMLLFLAVLAVLLLQDDDPETGIGRKSRKIPDPESALPPSPSVMHTYKHAAVSSDSQVCSDVARQFLKNGGTFDGILAALICNGIFQIQSMGLLGGFLLTVYIKSDRKAITVDARMTSPKYFRLPVRNFTGTGPSSIATPGFLKGLWEIHQKYGSVSWRKLIEPTLDLCNDGFTITKHLHDSMHINKRISNDPYLREVLMDFESQKFKRPGVKVTFKKHCKLLELLANHKESDIYSGAVGDLIAKDFNDAGSLITREDLTEYKTKWNDALEFPMTDGDILLLPNTAVMIPSILNIIKQYELNSLSFDGTDVNATILSHHRIVEAFKHVFAVRSQLGDPDFVDVQKHITHILSEEYAKQVVQQIDDTKTFSDPKMYSTKFVTPNDGGTSHISMVSANGDAISVTSSINYYFGSGMTGARTGLVFNNGMDDFSYPDRAVNYFGLQETPTNYPEPGKRALTSMSPIIVIDKNGNVKLVIGAAGGSKITSALSLALIRISCCTNNIKEIVDAPRFHHQLIPDEIEYEYGVTNQIVDGLAAKGHKLRRYKNRGTIVNALMCSENEINGVADFRKDWSGVSGY